MITKQHESGQAGIVAVAITTLIALVILGASISGMKMLGGQRTVTNQQSMQSYYVAMAGIQEALATRMYPASNFLNWRQPSAAVPPLYATAANEGVVCTDGAACWQDPSANRIGIYRYVVLNGDQGVNAAVSTPAAISYWADSQLNGQTPGIPAKIALEAFPTSLNDAASQFIVISKGVICVASNGANRKSGAAQAGALNTNRLAVGTAIAAYTAPTCQAGTVPDITTLVARVMIDRDTPNARDIVTNIAITKDDQAVSQIRVGRAYVPGQGWIDTNTTPINFETVFAYPGGAANNPATPAHAVFYDFVNNTIVCSRNITGTATNVDAAACGSGTNIINPRTAIQLYFQGPIDHRSLSSTGVAANDYTLTGCKGSMSNCNITVWKDNDNNASLTSCNATEYETQETGFQVIFTPPKNNQIKLLPSLSALPQTARKYQIRIDTNNIRGWSGATGQGSRYCVNFTVP